MTKTEIISRIIDRITDPWTESPEDYRYAELISLDEAADVLKQYRDDDDDCDLEPDERMPEEATPALLMEAFNCNVRHQKFELRVKRLAEFITDNELICEYANDYFPANDNAIDIVPVDFLYNSTRFPFSTHNTENPDIIDMLRIGMNSATTFHSNDEYCWFDKDKEILHSTNCPFRDGVLDAEAFAQFILTDKETLDYFLSKLMTNKDILSVFGCTAEELQKEMNH